MPVLIKNIVGKVSDNINSNVEAIRFVETSFGYKDWFKIGHLEVFIQNYKKVTEMTDLGKNRDIGLNINNNREFIELQISY
tara:strand:- start:4829 stop:5071 length:243 start_codon:yes stop_codon:yes gene_type:complete